MSEKRIIDWERLETQYRAGVMSLREIADVHEITEGAIRKRAKRDNWERDLSAKINAKADALVRRSEYAAGTQKTERDAIEAAATAIADIKLAHRTDIKRARELYERLIGELEADGEELKVRFGCLKQGVEVLKTLVALEADSWGFAHAPDEAPAEQIDSAEGARRIAFVLARAAAQPNTVH